MQELRREANRLLQRADLMDSDNIRCRWQNHVDTGECRFDCFDPVIARACVQLFVSMKAFKSRVRPHPATMRFVPAYAVLSYCRFSTASCRSSAEQIHLAVVPRVLRILLQTNKKPHYDFVCLAVLNFQNRRCGGRGLLRSLQLPQFCAELHIGFQRGNASGLPPRPPPPPPPRAAAPPAANSSTAPIRASAASAASASPVRSRCRRRRAPSRVRAPCGASRPS